MSRNPDRPATTLALLLVSAGLVIAWASAFPFISIIMKGGINPIPLAALRYGIAGLVMIPAIMKTRPSLKQLGQLLLCGLLGIASYNIFLNLGEEHVPAATTSLITAICPVLIAVLEALLWRRHLSRYGWLGSFICLLGVGIVCLNSSPHSSDGVQLSTDKTFILLATASNALFSIVQKPMAHHYGPIRTMGWTAFIGGICLSPWLPEGLAEAGQASPFTLLCLLWFAFIPSLLGYACWAWLVRQQGASRASITLYAIPPTAILLGMLLQHYTPNPAVLAGGVIIMGGMVLTRLR